MDTNIRGKKIKITKVQDFYADRGEIHPNGVCVGHSYEGIADVNLMIGQSLTANGDTWWTSRIQKINDDDTFETKIGVYKLEII